MTRTLAILAIGLVSLIAATLVFGLLLLPFLFVTIAMLGMEAEPACQLGYAVCLPLGLLAGGFFAYTGWVQAGRQATRAS